MVLGWVPFKIVSDTPTLQKKKRKRLFRFKIGQLVRISHQQVFIRAYKEQWSYEVFKTKRHFQMHSIHMYKLVDLLESDIKANVY